LWIEGEIWKRPCAKQGEKEKRMLRHITPANQIYKNVLANESNTSRQSHACTAESTLSCHKPTMHWCLLKIVPWDGNEKMTTLSVGEYSRCSTQRGYQQMHRHGNKIRTGLRRILNCKGWKAVGYDNDNLYRKKGIRYAVICNTNQKTGNRCGTWVKEWGIWCLRPARPIRNVRGPAPRQMTCLLNKASSLSTMGIERDAPQRY